MNNQTRTHRIPAAFVIIGLLLATSLTLFGLSACGQGPQGQNQGNQGQGQNQGEGKGQNREERQDAATVAEVGAKASDFTFTTLEGQSVNLSDYEGKVVVLNFWATWCGYCIEEMPDLNELTNAYEDVEIVAVNRGETLAEGKAFAETSGYDFIWGFDESGSAESLYPSRGIPYSVIIDKDGIIQDIFEGMRSYSDFESAVKAAGA